MALASRLLFVALALVGCARSQPDTTPPDTAPPVVKPSASPGRYAITLSTHDSTIAAPALPPGTEPPPVERVVSYSIDAVENGYEAIADDGGTITRKPIAASVVEPLVERILELCAGQHSAHHDPWIRVSGEKSFEALGGLATSGDDRCPAFYEVHADLLAAIRGALAK